MSFTLGAVAYDPKVVTIWGGFRTWFLERGFDFDYVLYSNYERQVEELLAGRIHAGWNSPLAWVRARRLAEASGRHVSAVAMRDTDRDLTSVIITRADGPIQSVSDLKGRIVGVGAVDSPQATLLPLAYLRSLGLEPEIRLLLGMSYADPDVRPLLDLEGLKEWCEGRTAGYAPLEAAVDALGFYSDDGRVTAADYRP